jgi:hypothetical protein
VLLINPIQLYGGMTDVDLEEADIVIVNSTNQGLQQIKARAHLTASPVWIHKCIQRGTCDFESMDSERRGRAASPASREPSPSPSNTGTTGKRPRRKRCEYVLAFVSSSGLLTLRYRFTPIDDLNLARFIANYMFELPKLCGNELYKYLVGVRALAVT